MKLSIVTISFNQGKFLEQCIQSVNQQSSDEVEYIVVDSGSTDGSREIIDKYRDQIKNVIFEPDQGPADGLNKGFSLASGEIFGYINSDDYYLPFAFDKIVRYFQNHPNVDVVSGNAQVINANNKILRYTFSDKFSLLGCAYGYSNLIQPSSFFRAEAFYKTQGFNIDNHSNWDGELFVDMKLNHANFKRINEYLSAYRIYNTSITGSGNLEIRIRDYSNRRFSRIMRRNRIWADNYFDPIFRSYRYLTNLRDLFQRIKYGPIYGRYSSKLRDKL